MRITNKKLLLFAFIALYYNVAYAENTNTVQYVDIVDVESENTTQENTITNQSSVDNTAIEEKINEIIDEVKIKDTKEINKANTVTIQALNKITGKSYEYKVKINDSQDFERLIITPLYCWKSSPSEIPENKVLLKVVENKINKGQEEIFYGWMFSSSPSISTLEHPMYDVKIVNCENIIDKEEKNNK